MYVCVCVCVCSRHLTHSREHSSIGTVMELDAAAGVNAEEPLIDGVVGLSKVPRKTY